MKGKLGAARLAAYYDDPVRAEERRQRARDLLRDPEVRRKRRAAARGCDVPAELETEWRRLKQEKRLSNAEAARALGLKFKRRQSGQGIKRPK